MPNTKSSPLIDPQTRAEILVQAIPYIQRFAGKTIVIKYGGGAMLNQALMQSVMSDLLLLQLMGMRLVLVHGGGPFINRALEAIGHTSQWENGLRVTDATTMQVAQEVLAGGVNKTLVRAVGAAGGRALGICGLDGRLLTACKHDGDVDLGYVGDIESVDCRLLNDGLDKGYLMVVASIAGGRDGQVYNVNADHAAAAIAAGCGAQKLILMTDVLGVLTDKDDPSSLISVLPQAQVPDLLADGTLKGGMIPKLTCCLDALSGGVQQAHILDGTLPHAILLELLSDDGIGTMVY
ncbi:acetylglutamate kinase [Peptococcus niger]|uniref:Acetylglutamate kinase n=1 Tax=Peptococcus niger TaxID=2741 RepID=A0A1G6UDF9_PEPNI|nr:acetylglutamate kinase [Peptococcus niger]MBS5915273.1 acetylglutamate kinase [Clostridiales bacterium]SDD39289.1 N-acetylglutamate kinase [Peptococcus niger]